MQMLECLIARGQLEVREEAGFIKLDFPVKRHAAAVFEEKQAK